MISAHNIGRKKEGGGVGEERRRKIEAGGEGITAQILFIIINHTSPGDM